MDENLRKPYGSVRIRPDGASMGIGGVGLFGNKRPYITITDGGTTWTLGSLHPRISPEKFWELMEKFIGMPIVDEEAVAMGELGKESPDAAS